MHVSEIECMAEEVKSARPFQTHGRQWRCLCQTPRLTQFMFLCHPTLMYTTENDGAHGLSGVVDMSDEGACVVACRCMLLKLAPIGASRIVDEGTK